MSVAGSRALAASALGVCLAALGCGGSSSPATAPTTMGVAGQWSGTTDQSRPITFSVTPDDRVTSISVGYNFNGCSGTQTYSNLSIDIKPSVTCIPGPCPPGLTSYRSLQHGDGDFIQGPYTQISGFIGEIQGTFTAEGVASFRNYPGCGSALTAWRATRR